MSRFRGWIQAGATLLTNLHLPNFLKGGLYQGAGKTVCVPGLNCYSCPAASGACPIGAFQAVVGSSKFSFSYYITGFLILLGRFAGALHLRLSVPLRLVSGAAAQNPHEEAFHKEAEAADIPQVRRSAGDGLPAAGVPCERRGHGRPVLLQIPLPPGRAGGSHPAVPCQFRHPGGAGQVCLHGNSASCCR